MIKIIALILLAAALSSPCLAQQTGARLTPGAGIDITRDVVSTKLPPKDQSGGAYTILAADNAFLLEIGAGAATLPQAGSAGFPANWAICIINISLTTNVNINTTTSIFRGAGETTTLKLAPGGWACVESDGTNWIAVHRRGNPIVNDVSQARTLSFVDCDTTVFFSSASAIAVALSATAPPGCSVDVIQGGAGLITFASSGSGTLSNFDGFTKTAGQKAGVTLRVMTNAAGNNAAWYLFGRGQP